MNIAVINATQGGLPDEDIQDTIRAVNHQIRMDFAPYWGITASLRLQGAEGFQPNAENDRVRGDGVIYIWNQANLPGALGYHFLNNRGLPYGFVFWNLAGHQWTVTLSHEALEILADPEANRFAVGPHPDGSGSAASYEVCDAVQADTYGIDGIELSDFVLPLYFTLEDEAGSRNSFLGRGNPALGSFRVRPGGYMAYYDLSEEKWEAVYGETLTKEAEQLVESKTQQGITSRRNRYEARIVERDARGIQLKEDTKGKSVEEICELMREATRC